MCGVLDISQAWEVDAANQIPLWSYRDLMGGCQRDGLQLTYPQAIHPSIPSAKPRSPDL